MEVLINPTPVKRLTNTYYSHYFCYLLLIWCCILLFKKGDVCIRMRCWKKVIII